MQTSLNLYIHYCKTPQFHPLCFHGKRVSKNWGRNHEKNEHSQKQSTHCTLTSATGSGHVKYMATPFFYFYMTTGHVLISPLN